jgi:hypothetical protein
METHQAKENPAVWGAQGNARGGVSLGGREKYFTQADHLPITCARMVNLSQSSFPAKLCAGVKRGPSHLEQSRNLEHSSNLEQ